ALLVVGATSRFGWPPHRGRGGVALGLAALIVAGATAWWRSQPHAAPVRVAPLGALAGLLAALAIGWPVQAHYLRGRYADRRDCRYDYVVFPSAGARTERAWTTSTAGGVVPVAATSGLVVRLSSPPDPRTCPPR